MKTSKLFLLLAIFCNTFILYASLSGQPIAYSRQNAMEAGIRIPELDSLYQSAVHVDSTQAVFRTQEGMTLVHQEYEKLLQALGQYLKENGFVWAQPTEGFNRIYFNKNGQIDYFIFSFRGEGRPDAEKEKEFARLLNKFISTYKVNLAADRKFAQCSPVKYMPN